MVQYRLKLLLFTNWESLTGEIGDLEWHNGCYLALIYELRSSVGWLVIMSKQLKLQKCSPKRDTCPHSK